MVRPVVLQLGELWSYILTNPGATAQIALSAALVIVTVTGFSDTTQQRSRVIGKYSRSSYRSVDLSVLCQIPPAEYRACSQQSFRIPLTQLSIATISLGSVGPRAFLWRCEFNTSRIRVTAGDIGVISDDCFIVWIIVVIPKIA